MTYYTLQVTNHPEAFRRIPTEAASKSWETVYDGPIASASEARNAVDQLAAFYRCARVFKGKAIGKLHYGVFR
jgi:hypothetical protein